MLMSEETQIAKKIVKRKGQWCVIHMHGKDKGKVIKCYDSYDKALRLHRAIMVSQQQRKKELNVGLYVPKPHAELIHRKQQRVIIVDKKYNIANINFVYCDNELSYGTLKLSASKEIISYEEFNKLRKYHKITDEQFKNLGLDYPVFIHFIKEVRNFESPIEIDLPEGTKSFIKNPIQYMKPKDIIKSTITLSKEEYKEIVEGYKLKPLPDKYYSDRKDGKAFSQMHLRGLKPEDREAWEKGKLSFQKLILGHSLHIDLRLKLEGLDKLVQYIITESDMKSYIRGMKGDLNPEQAGPANVQKMKIISKPSGEPPEGLPKSKEKGDMLIDSTGAKIIDKCILHKRSYIIPKGGVGATSLADAYLGLIWEGNVKEGTQREDMHEYFFYPDNDLPDLNKKLFNGRFIIRCFKGTEGRADTWWMWKATKNLFPINSWCHIDKGFHYLIPANTVKRFGHEDYKIEWKERKEKC